MNDNPFELKSSRRVYNNPWINVREDAVVRPDGSDGIFGVVEVLHGVSVLPLLNDGSVLLAREFKYAVNDTTVEVFSGGIDAGETPEQAARRELLEESGYSAQTWLNIGVVDPFTSVIESRVHLFLAIDAAHSAQPTTDPGEQISVVACSFDEALKMVMESQITHAPSCVAILKAARWRVEHRSGTGPDA